MKKFFTIIAFVSVLAFSLSSCTEEEVKPATTGNKTGGSVSVENP